MGVQGYPQNGDGMSSHYEIETDVVFWATYASSLGIVCPQHPRDLFRSWRGWVRGG